eukprot:m.135238 g.135238  ORF g.135238 m.135238 type:complete len:123 (+) comp15986_c0_seq11:892-1260(+)
MRDCLQAELIKRDEAAKERASVHDKLRQAQLQLTLAQAQSASSNPELPEDLGLDDVTAMYKEQYEALRKTLQERTLDQQAMQQQVADLKAEMYGCSHCHAAPSWAESVGIACLPLFSGYCAR